VKITHMDRSTWIAVGLQRIVLHSCMFYMPDPHKAQRVVKGCVEAGMEVEPRLATCLGTIRY
jgi:hypothetical protein